MLRSPRGGVNVSDARGEPADRLETKVSGHNPQPAHPARGASRLAPGEEIDDFLLLDKLGAGAFATVYLAHQQSLHRTVALKIFADPSREAQTLAQVDHPNIVRVHDQRHAADDNLQLLYMEYVPGGTLENLVDRVAETPPAARRGQLVLDALDASLAKRGVEPPLDSQLRQRLAEGSWPEAVCLLGAHMAVALDFAHSRGVLHRDVKPANVLLDATGRAKLADFNISSATGLDTEEEGVGGTLPYMAPEQVRAVSPWHDGGAADLDERSDIYGLGVVLWELLTGTRPFPEPPRAKDMRPVLDHLISTRSAGVGDEVVRGVDPSVPPMIVDTLHACLAPDPADRPQSGAELRRRLEWCLDPHLRRLFKPTTGGWLCARSWLCRVPLLGLIVTVFLPNALLSALNVEFNVNTVVDEPDQPAFMEQALIVNGIAFPLGIAVFVFVGWIFRRTLRARVQGAPTLPQERATAREQGLRLGATMATVILVLWMVGGLVFPIWQHMRDGAADAHAWFNFTLSNTMFGLLAAMLSFFLLHAIVSRVFLPRLVAPGDIDDASAQRMGRLQRRLVWAFAACTTVPSISVILLAAGPNLMAGMGQAFLVLGFIGALAFGATLALGALIRRDLAALQRALAAPRDRFRAPI